MNRCGMGYSIKADGTPPDRCHNDRKSEIGNCKQCPAYNHEPDLITQAIESARCRIYRLKHSCGKTKSHQVKAKNQQELMEITIKALEFYREYID